MTDAMIIDIETLPGSAPQHRAQWGHRWADAPPHGYQLTDYMGPEPVRRTPPSTWRDPAKIARRQAELDEAYADEVAAVARKAHQAAWAAWRKESLDPTRLCIHSACWTVDGTHVHEAELGADGDDRPVLEAIEQAISETRPRWLVSWSDYDAVALWNRAMHHGMSSLAWRVSEVPYGVRMQLGIKSSHPIVVDAMRLWAHQYGRRPGLGAACRLLGIDHELENPIDGSEVLDAYLEGRDDDIIDHCRADVRDLWHVWQRLSSLYGMGRR